MLTMRPHLRAHIGHEGRAHQERAVQINGLHSPPVSERHFGERFQGKDTSAIDKDIAVAETGGDLCQEHVDGVFRGDIAFPGEHVPSGLFDEPDRIGCGKRVGDDDVSPILCKAMCKRLPDAARRTRNDSNFVLMRFCHGSSAIQP